MLKYKNLSKLIFTFRNQNKKYDYLNKNTNNINFNCNYSLIFYSFYYH